MATIAASQMSLLKQEGTGEQYNLLKITGVTDGDSFNSNSITPTGEGSLGAAIAYKKVKIASFIVAGALDTEAAGALSGSPATTITLNLATMANDTVYLQVLGQV